MRALPPKDCQFGSSLCTGPQHAVCRVEHECASTRHMSTTTNPLIIYCNRIRCSTDNSVRAFRGCQIRWLFTESAARRSPGQTSIGFTSTGNLSSACHRLYELTIDLMTSCPCLYLELHTKRRDGSRNPAKPHKRDIESLTRRLDSGSTLCTPPDLAVNNEPRALEL
jgi:hypothetical protein